MTFGERLKMIRNFKGLTQKQLGEMSGIHEVAIRKYELNKVHPKPEQVEKIAMALMIPKNLLLEIDINTDSDVLPLFFAIDERFPVTIIEVDGNPAIQFKQDSLDRFLKDWQSMKELVEVGQQSEDNYEFWKIMRPGITKVIKGND